MPRPGGDFGFPFHGEASPGTDEIHEEGPEPHRVAPPVRDVVHEAAVLLVVNEALRGPCESGTVGLEPLPTYDRRSERFGDDLEPAELWHRRGEMARNLSRHIVHGYRLVAVAEGDVHRIDTQS